MSIQFFFTASPLYSRCTPHFELNPHVACEQVLRFGGIMRRQASTAPKRRLKCQGFIPYFLHSRAFTYGLFHLLSKWRVCLLTNPTPFYQNPHHFNHKSNFWGFFLCSLPGRRSKSMSDRPSCNAGYVCKAFPMFWEKRVLGMKLTTFCTLHTYI